MLLTVTFSVAYEAQGDLIEFFSGWYRFKKVGRAFLGDEAFRVHVIELPVIRGVPS